MGSACKRFIRECHQAPHCRREGGSRSYKAGPARALANPTGNSGVRRALQSHPELGHYTPAPISHQMQLPREMAWPWEGQLCPAEAIPKELSGEGGLPTALSAARATISWRGLRAAHHSVPHKHCGGEEGEAVLSEWEQMPP